MKKTTKATTAVKTKISKLSPASQTGNDLRNAILIVSLLLNLFVLALWLVVLCTSKYDSALTSLLFNR